MSTISTSKIEINFNNSSGKGKVTCEFLPLSEQRIINVSLNIENKDFNELEIDELISKLFESVKKLETYKGVR